MSTPADTTSPPSGTASPEGDATRRGRWLRRVLPVIPVLIAIGGFLYVMNQDDRVVESPTVDLSEIPVERLEAMLSSSRGDPLFTNEMPGLLMVLAERHFSENSYDRSFELYAELLTTPGVRRAQAALALSRMAWIGWVATGDPIDALTTIEQSIRFDPTNAESYFVKGHILWCGLGDNAAALEQFETVLRAGDLSAQVRDRVIADLDRLAAGEPCT